LCELEGAADCVLAPSGLAAIQLALLATLGAGDHVLVADTVYSPVRNLCKRVLPRFGIEPQFYDPLIGAGIATLLRPNTKVVYVESPGSQTFEVQDIPAIADAAHRAGALVIADNAWASGYFFPALALGVDISVLPCTKYVVGHSDAMVGAVLSNESAKDRVRHYWADTGTAIGPDDAWLALRGLRTLPVRLEQHSRNALAIAQWLEGRPEVERVLYPALESHPQHALWKRDFRGACGLFSFVPRTTNDTQVSDRQAAAFIDALQFFSVGASWGGFESLALLAKPERTASQRPWSGNRSAIRLQVGLENVDDLIADLERGFAAMNAAANS
jgi:cysteine-S-conjugate beta-lyase